MHGVQRTRLVPQLAAGSREGLEGEGQRASVLVFGDRG